jgi:photosystem II stability/assembly factor-like uncharacterized protein
MPYRALACCLFLAQLTSAYASVGVWTASGPPGGAIFSVVQDPFESQLWYAATQGGVFKSTDGGSSWSSASKGLYPGLAWPFSAHPTWPGALFSGTERGLYRSRDRGEHWDLVLAAPNAYAVRTLAIAASEPVRIVVGLTDRLLTSTDGGESWQEHTTGMPPGPGTSLPRLNCLTVDRVDPRIVYAGSSEHGLLRSVDGGAWSKWNTDSVHTVAALAIDPVEPWILYANAASAETFGIRQVHKSTDGGKTWSLSGTGVPINQRWMDFSFDTSDSRLWYLGSDQGAYRSSDAGASWQLLLETQPVGTVYSIALDRHVPDKLFVAAHYGLLLRSLDGGETFSASPEGIVSSAVSRIALDPQDSRTVYAAVNEGTRLTAVGRLYKSTDAGAHWQLTGYVGGPIHSIQVDPSNAGVLYVGSSNGFWKSTDGGDGWLPSNPASLAERVGSIAIDPANPARLIASFGFEPHRSPDAGATWTRVAQLPAFGGCRSGGSFRFSPHERSKLYASSCGALFVSEDGAESWTLVAGVEGSDIWDFSFHPEQPGLLYAGVERRFEGDGPSGLVEIREEAGSWSQMDLGPSASGLPVTSVVVEPGSHGTLYAGIGWGSEVFVSGGILRSTDRGQSWQPLDEGLLNLDVRALLVSSSLPRRFYVATGGGGVYELSTEAAAADVPLSAPGAALALACALAGLAAGRRRARRTR